MFAQYKHACMVVYVATGIKSCPVHVRLVVLEARSTQPRTRPTPLSHPLPLSLLASLPFLAHHPRPPYKTGHLLREQFETLDCFWFGLGVFGFVLHLC